MKDERGIDRSRGGETRCNEIFREISRRFSPSNDSRGSLAPFYEFCEAKFLPRCNRAREVHGENVAVKTITVFLNAYGNYTIEVTTRVVIFIAA